MKFWLLGFGFALLSVVPLSGANVAPTLTTQPTNQSVLVGAKATFSVSATGTGTLTYQWYKNSVTISGATSSTYTTPVTASTDNGATFKVKVSNSYGNVTSNSVTLTVNQSPSITSQPASQTVALGAKATFSVSATGTGTLTYRWSRNGTPTSGATSATYTTPATVATDNGATFSVKVTNSYGSTTSSSATLTVNLPPTITSQPANQSVNLGTTATFSVSAAGTGTLTYQWSKNATGISGATSSTYTTPATVSTDNGAAFSVKVTNSYGSTTSSSATLSVNLPPTITTQPANQSVKLGATATYSVSATGTGTLTYQWSKNGNVISGATSATYTTPATVATDSGATFSVKVMNGFGSTTSSNATLTVNLPPTITTQPANQSVNVGGKATFTVSAIGTEPISYQWQKNSSNISGATTASYTTPATTLSDNGAKFQVLVTNAGGSITSTSASLTVNNPPPSQPVITAPAVVTAGQSATASIPSQSGCTYSWSISGGSIVSGGNSTTATFKANPIPILPSPNAYPPTVVLGNGKVLVVGGEDSNYDAVATADLFDPSTNVITQISASMKSPRSANVVVVLKNGKVLIAGYDQNAGSGEIYDPSNSTFTSIGCPMVAGRVVATGTLLANGTVLIAGGTDISGTSAATAEIFDPATLSFTATNGLMTTQRSYHTATLLGDGTILIAGGLDSNNNPIKTAEVYNPSTGTFAEVAGSLNAARAWHTANLLPSGQVLFAGGNDNVNSLDSCEIFDVKSQAFTLLPSSMSAPRSSHTGTTLPNGKVLLLGGYTTPSETDLDTGEIFDPSTGQFSVVGGVLSTPREGHGAVALSDGRVFIIGGTNGGVALASADEYLPTSNSLVGFGASLSVTVTNSNGASSTPGTAFVQVLPAVSNPVVTAPAYLLENSTGATASVPPQSGCTYSWTITNGTIANGDGTNTVVFQAGVAGTPLTLSCKVSNAAGSYKTGSATITIYPSVVSLSPVNAAVATGGQISLTSNQPVTWSLSAGSLSYSNTSATYTAAYNGVNLVDGTYTVTATSKLDSTQSATSYITVYVDGSAVINSFSATPASVHAGQAVTLNWTTTNATNLTLISSSRNDYASQTVTGSSIVVQPQETTYYSLHAAPSSMDVYANIQVPVDMIPAVSTFQAATAGVPLGGSTQLTASFTNGTAQIDHGVGPVQDGVPVTVTPTAFTRYNLTVTNPYGATITEGTAVNVLLPGSYLPSPNMVEGQLAATTTTLCDGRILYVGGFGQTSSGSWNETTSTAQVFDYNSNCYVEVGGLNNDRANHTATLGVDGRVLIWGGEHHNPDSNTSYLPSYEIFDPSTNEFIFFPVNGLYLYPNSIATRVCHTANLLADGRVLIAGGYTLRDGPAYSAWAGDFNTLETCLLVDFTSSPGSPTFSVTGSLAISRYLHVSVRLLDGRVLVAGGCNVVGSPGTQTQTTTQLTSAEIFDPIAGTWSPAGNLADPAHAKNPVLLPDGRVVFDGKEIWDPASLSFSSVPTPYFDFTGFGTNAALLPDGMIHMGQAETDFQWPVLFDPTNNAGFGVSCLLAGPGNYLYLNVLQDGSVLSAGNFIQNNGNIGNVGTKTARLALKDDLEITPIQTMGNINCPVKFAVSGPASTNVSWSASGGTIGPDGTFTAASEGLYAVTATSPTGVHAIAWIDVHSPIQVIYKGRQPSPSNGLNAGVPCTLSVYVLNTPNQGVIWSVQEGAQGGTVTQNGVFTAAAAGTWHVKATSVMDSTKFCVIGVPTLPPISLTISPATISVAPGATVTFTLSEPSGATTANWSGMGQSGYGASATFTAPIAPGTYPVTAVSTWDPTKSVTATIQVLPVLTFTLTPSTTIVEALGRVDFSAQFTTANGTQDVSRLTTLSCNGGSFSNGYYQAPLTPGTYSIQGTYPGMSLVATATVTVVPLTGFYISPERYVLAPGESVTLSSFVTSSQGHQSPPGGTNWSCSGGTFLTSFDSAQFLAPSSLGTYQVQATLIGSNLQATATIMVVNANAFATNGSTAKVTAEGTATRLLNGQVLIAGNGAAEIYDPATKSFSSVASPMIQSRWGHGAILLPNGQVLFVGGVTDTTKPNLAEVFDPSTNQFSATQGAPLFRREPVSLGLLPNGKVLVAGPDGYSDKSLEVFDPQTGCFNAVGYLRKAYKASYTLSLPLADGRVLFTTSDPNHSDRYAEIFDFKTNQTTLITPSNHCCSYCSILQNGDGKAWELGIPSYPSTDPLAAEWFDPSSNEFTVGSPVSDSDVNASFGALEAVDGTILIYGTSNPSELDFNPSTGFMSPLRSISSGNSGFYQKAVLLPTGDCLVVSYANSPGTRNSALQVLDTAPKVAVFPRHITLVQGQSWPFQASATGLGNAGFNWTADAGSVSPLGVYTAPYAVGTYRVTATSGGDGFSAAAAIVDVIQDEQVFINPTVVQLPPGGTQTFKADVTSVNSPMIAWSSTGGLITPSGVYTAGPIPGTYLVTATSMPDGNSVNATVVISSNGSSPIPPPSIGSFTLDTPIVEVGQPVNLAWDVSGAYQLTLNINGVATDVTGQTSLTYPVSATTQFVLVVQNPAGRVTSSILTVNVSSQPVTIAITPNQANIYVKGQQQFGFNLSAPTNRMVWSATAGTITQAGLYTAPPIPGTYQVTVTSVDDPTKSSVATLTVQDLDLQISPAMVNLDPGQGLQFGFTCSGTTGTDLVWSCSAGTINSAGFYTAPNIVGSYSVLVYSQTEPSIVRSATVNVVNPLVQITPGSAMTGPGGQVSFQALVRSGSVVWSVVGTSSGTITQNGTYTAPQGTGTYQVKATSSIDPNQCGLATVVVVAGGGSGSGGWGSGTASGSTGVQLTLNPTMVQTIAGTYFPFQASVAGAANTAVLWTVIGTPPMASINTEGVFISTQRGSYQIQAQAAADPSVVLTAEVLVSSSLTLNTPQMVSGSFDGYSVTGLKDGRVLIAGGAQFPQTGAAVGRDGSVNYVSSGQALIYDPATNQYSQTGTMQVPRNFHQAVLLPDGKVLIMGGFAQWANPWTSYVDSPPVVGQPYTTWDQAYPAAEIYDPSSGTFQTLPSGKQVSPTSPATGTPYYRTDLVLDGLMMSTHPNGVAITLSNGDVLSVGGDGRGFWGGGVDLVDGGCYGPEPLDLYNHQTGTFDFDATAPWRSGLGFTFNVPTNNPMGQSTEPLAYRIAYGFGQQPRAVNLADGRTLITSGTPNDGGAGYWYQYQQYDTPVVGMPATSSANALILDSNGMVSSGTTDMNLPRFAATLTLLPDGRVLMIGGQDWTRAQSVPRSEGTAWNWASTDTAEIYDPKSDTWIKSNGHLAFARGYHAAQLLPTGKVLVIGGAQTALDGSVKYPNAIELYDPDADSFSVMDTLDYGISNPQLAMMNDGTVFVAGQVQAPMNPPTTQQSQSQAMSRLARSASPDIMNGLSLLVGSSFFGSINQNYPPLISVQFTSDHNLLRASKNMSDWTDLCSKYSKPEWKYSSNSKTPISQTVGTNLTISAQIKIPSGNQYTLNGIGTHPYTTFQSSGTGTGKVQTISMTAQAALPGAIGILSETINWSMVSNGQTTSLGTMGPFLIYVTYGTPIITNQWVTDCRLNWCCTTANGESTLDGIANDIWNALFNDPPIEVVDSNSPDYHPKAQTDPFWVLMGGGYTGQCIDLATLMMQEVQQLGGPASQGYVFGSTDTNCFSSDPTAFKTRTCPGGIHGIEKLYVWSADTTNKWEGVCVVNSTCYAVKMSGAKGAPIDILRDWLNPARPGASNSYQFWGYPDPSTGKIVQCQSPGPDPVPAP